MFSVEKRFLLFLLVCIPVRIILALIPLYIDSDRLPYYGGILLILAIGLLFLYFNKLRLHAREGGGQTWWSEYRLLHGGLFLTAAIYSFQKKRVASVPMAIDVGMGLVMFILHHWKSRS